MAVKGLDIFKLTPKKNCKECGFPTCMAFSMKVAAGAAEIDKCPYITDEAKAQLSEATAPPMKTIKIGTGDTECALGGETVLFRHEKTYVNKALFAVEFSDADSDDEIAKKAAHLEAVKYDRIGELMCVEVASVRYAADKAKFLDLIAKVIELGRVPMAVVEDVEVAKEAAEAIKAAKGILMGATPANADAMVEVAKAADVVLGVSAGSIEELHDTVEKIEAAGYKNLVLNVGDSSVKEAYNNAVTIRTNTLKGDDRTFGYPSVVFVNKIACCEQMEVALASAFVLRYGSIIVMSDMDFKQALPLFGLRQNIFTDPQKPMRVEPTIYEFNKADDNSPVLVTVDFALSYFVVSGEIERSKVPAYLAIPDAGGYSVLTAWAAGKFGASVISDFIKESGIADKTKCRKLILPGKVAVLQGDVAEALPDWEVIVGPTEAMQIPKFLRDLMGIA